MTIHFTEGQRLRLDGSTCTLVKTSPSGITVSWRGGALLHLSHDTVRDLWQDGRLALLVPVRMPPADLRGLDAIPDLPERMRAEVRRRLRYVSRFDQLVTDRGPTHARAAFDVRGETPEANEEGVSPKRRPSYRTVLSWHRRWVLCGRDAKALLPLFPRSRPPVGSGSTCAKTHRRERRAALACPLDGAVLTRTLTDPVAGGDQAIRMLLHCHFGRDGTMVSAAAELNILKQVGQPSPSAADAPGPSRARAGDQNETGTEDSRDGTADLAADAFRCWVHRAFGGEGADAACLPRWLLPSKVVVDNAREFHAESFRAAAVTAGITLVFRPARPPFAPSAWHPLTGLGGARP